MNIDEIRRAASRLAPHVLATPCEPSPWLSAVAGRPVWIKWESLQRTGSFKLRGALNKLLVLGERGVDRVLCVSAGNHGLGVAHGARLLGMRATVVVPEGAARTKVESIRRLGAELVVGGATYDDAEAAARDLAAKQQVEFVSPYNDAEVIAGQATATLEALAQAQLDELLVPVGGGGLAAGAVIVAEALGGPAVFGVQPAHAPAMARSLAAGRIVPADEQPTFADGLAGNVEAGSITFAPLARGLRGMHLVGERAIRDAVVGLVRHEHMIVEASGAVGVAAILEGRCAGTGALGVIATGRNIDADRLSEILSSPS